MSSFNFGGVTVVEVDRRMLLVGSWFATITWGIEALQLANYLTHFSNDAVFLKAGVIFLFCADTAWNVLLCISTYVQLLKVKPDSLDKYTPSLELCCAPMASAFVIAGVNMFLIYRYSKLTRRLWISILLFMVTLVAFSCHLWSASLSLGIRNLNISDFASWKRAYDHAGQGARIGLSLEVAMVCSIWILILFHLLCLLRRDMMDARKIVMRLVLVNLESGTCASAVAIASLVWYLGHPSDPSSIVFSLFIARVYLMNMLYNLTMRGSGGHLMRNTSSQSHIHHTSGYNGDSISLPLSHLSSKSGEQSHVLHNVVHVSQSIDTRVDKGKEHEAKERDLEQQL